MHALSMPATFDAEARSQDRASDDRWVRFQVAMGVLRARLHGNGASDLVLAELVEDDLRQARVALHAIGDFLDEAVQALGNPNSCAADVVNAGDPHPALDACERLENTLPGLRRRMGQVALRLTRR